VINRRSRADQVVVVAAQQRIACGSAPSSRLQASSTPQRGREPNIPRRVARIVAPARYCRLNRSFQCPIDRATPARLDSKPQNSRRSPGGTEKESPAGQGGALGAKRGQRLFVAAIHKARMTGWPLPALQEPSLDSGKPVDSFCLLGRAAKGLAGTTKNAPVDSAESSWRATRGSLRKCLALVGLAR
jgi:hypothetical protein